MNQIRYEFMCICVKGVVRLNQEDLHNQGFSYKNLINCVKLMK